MELTINDYLKGGFNLVIQTNNVNKYEGLLYGKSGYIYLSDSDLKDLKKYGSIYEYLKNSYRIMKISYSENIYILQTLDKHYEGPYNEQEFYLLEDLETSNNLLELLEKYNNKKEEEYKNERNILS